MWLHNNKNGIVWNNFEVTSWAIDKNCLLIFLVERDSSETYLQQWKYCSLKMENLNILQS